MHFPRSLPLQTLIVVSFSSHILEYRRLVGVELLVEDGHSPHSRVSVEVQEESIGGLFWHGRVHLAGRARGARCLQLEHTTQVGIYPKTQMVVVVAHLRVVEAQTCLIE
jgi:hypothetical protein